MSEPILYLFALIIVLLLSISKSGLGGGLNALSLPLLALVIDPRLAAAVLLPILFLIDLVSLVLYRRRWHLPSAKTLLVGGAVGLLVGAVVFRSLNADGFRLLLGFISIGFGLNGLANFVRQPTRIANLENKTAGAAYGVLAGFSSFVAHSGGPLVQMYLLPKRLDRTAYQATVVLFFFCANTLKLFGYSSLGQLTLETLLQSAYLIPAVPFGVAAGKWLHNRIAEKPFYLVCYIALMLTGMKLTYDGLGGLL